MIEASRATLSSFERQPVTCFEGNWYSGSRTQSTCGVGGVTVVIGTREWDSDTSVSKDTFITEPEGIEIARASAAAMFGDGVGVTLCRT
jgi:hypothetical protein